MVNVNSYRNFDEAYAAVRGKAKFYEMREVTDAEPLSDGETGLRLVAVQGVEQTITVKSRTEGRNKLVKVKLYPGKTYAVPSEDTVLIKDIQQKKGWILYSTENEETLRNSGVEYEVKKGCGSCKSSRTTIKYSLVEVVNNE